MDAKKLLAQLEERVTKWEKLPGSDVEVFLKHLIPDDLDRIGKKRELYKGPSGKMNFQLYREAVLKEVVVNWKNFTLDGEPLPCSDENKVAMDKAYLPFRMAWFKVSGLSAQDEEEEGDELGNSSSGPSST